MRLDVEDNIAAIATAPGPALRGAIRISGPTCLGILDQLIQNETVVPDATCSVDVSRLRSSTTIQASIWLDSLTTVDATFLVWPGKQSFTRQPSIEIHCIGSGPVLQKILQMLFQSGVRPAEPGEFTLRAFLSGRLDLTQAEAVLGLIDAKNQRQFQTALQQVAGGIGGPITEVRDELIGTLAELEAGLDFVEDDIEFVTNEQIVESLQKSIRNIDEAVKQIHARKMSREMLTVVLAGRPNAGKSSLFNLLADQSAIVSNQPGTTRDYLHAELSINGRQIRLVDTAGLEDLGLENLGLGNRQGVVGEQMLQQSKSQIASGDIRLFCIDSSRDFDDSDFQIFENDADSTIIVFTKIDQRAPADIQVQGWAEKVVRTSAVECLGIEELRSAISDLAEVIGGQDSTESSTTARIERSLLEVQNSIGLALAAAEQGSGEEIVAAEIRGGLEHLGMIVGTVYTDDILDQVFSRFCIGK